MKISTAAKIVDAVPWPLNHLVVHIVWQFIKNNEIKLTKKGEEKVNEMNKE